MSMIQNNSMFMDIYDLIWSLCKVYVYDPDWIKFFVLSIDDLLFLCMTTVSTKLRPYICNYKNTAMQNYIL